MDAKEIAARNTEGETQGGVDRSYRHGGNKRTKLVKAFTCVMKKYGTLNVAPETHAKSRRHSGGEGLAIPAGVG